MENRFMKVTILGTGTFYVSAKRSGPAYFLEVDNKNILIDCGPGTLIRLSEIGIDPKDLDYIFITHFHADHTSDLFALQMSFRLNEFFGEKELKKFPIIYGPPGIEIFTKKLGQIYQLPAFDNFTKIKYKVNQESLQLGSLLVKPFRVKHTASGLSVAAYAFRFEFGGKVFTFSGDSIKHEGLENASKNADVFICDCSYTKGKGSPAHLNTHELGEIAEKSRVKKVFLTHIYPNLEDIDLVSEVKEKFSGEVIMGEDKIEINI